VSEIQEIRFGSIVSDRFQKNRKALPLIRQEPRPEIDALARPPDCSPRAAREGEVQENHRLRGTNSNLGNIQFSHVTVYDPPPISDKQLLGVDLLLKPFDRGRRWEGTGASSFLEHFSHRCTPYRANLNHA